MKPDKSYLFDREEAIIRSLRLRGLLPWTTTDADLDQVRDYQKKSETARQQGARAEAVASFLELQKAVEGANEKERETLKHLRLLRKRKKLLSKLRRAFGQDGFLSREDTIFEELQHQSREAAALTELQAHRVIPESPISTKDRDAARAKVLELKAVSNRVTDPGKQAALQEEINTQEAMAELLEAQYALEQNRDPDKWRGLLETRNEKLWNLLPHLRLSALTFSGGGVRSASFCLGVAQGLARCSYDNVSRSAGGILTELNFLSTVSGGGYTGSWLTRWSTPTAGTQTASFDNTIIELAKQRPAPADPEPKPLRTLRDYTSYLAPKVGAFTADAWTIIATYFRNLLLNWTMYIPFAMIVCILPVINVDAVDALSGNQAFPYWLYAALLTLGIGLFLIALALPSMGSVAGKMRLMQRLVPIHSLLLLVSAATLTLWELGSVKGALAGVQSNGLSDDPLAATLVKWFGGTESTWHFVDDWIAPALLLGLPLLAFGIWRFIGLRASRNYGGFKDRWYAVRYWLAHVAILGLVVAFFKLIFRHILPSLYDVGLQITPKFQSWHGVNVPQYGGLYAMLAVPIVLAGFLFMSWVMNGLLSIFESDEDREWWARSAAYLMMFSTIWILVHTLVFYSYAHTVIHYVATTVLATAGPALAWVGFSPQTASGPGKPKLSDLNKLGKLLTKWNLLVPLLCTLFLVAFVIVIAIINEHLLRWVKDFVGLGIWSVYLMVLTALAAVMFIASASINVNTFSMHGFYRNRLMRAFLGSANLDPDRKLDPYTKFANDNIAMSDIPVYPRAPLHVINMALNVVATKKLAWQERKAESFTVDALHAGNDILGYQPTIAYGGDRGLTLATSMAISGAAASPNMGYHSSSLMTLLLALFNVRLGWWLANPGPAGIGKHEKPSPTYSLGALLREAAGQTNDTYKWVYLSDGGHFENLGLYEMVLRRCHTIIVVDGSADPDYSFEDLAGAFRKIYIDSGIPIEPVCDPAIQPGRGARNKHCAVFNIRYSCVHPKAPDGNLIYLKASLCSKLPEDVKHFATLHPDFPHQSTMNQFFRESQFESYRRLGSHVIEHVLAGVSLPTIMSLEEFTDEAKAYACPAAAANAGAVVQGSVQEVTEFLQSGKAKITIRMDG